MNTTFMAIRYFNMPINYSNILDISNYTFALIYNLEAIIKIIAIGKRYFYIYWNDYDFLVVIGTNVGIFFKIFS